MSLLAAERKVRNRVASRDRYRRQIGHAPTPYHCRRCGEPGHYAKTCAAELRSEPVAVKWEGIVVRLVCSCGARLAGTFSPDEVIEIVAAHRHRKGAP